MKHKSKVVLISLVVIAIGLLSGYLLRHANFAVFNPKGEIGLKERNLIYEALLLSLFVVVPVFLLTFFIVWRYRDTNTKVTAKYSPDWDHSRLLETIWWGIPTILIVILSVMTWNSSHALDPFKVLNSTTRPLTIQVVALQWKWLFIYPEQHIASVNFVQFPTGTPVNFMITADAPMNSFWIPQLGGQVYAMPGMSTQLHLIASANGSYRGLSANLSGQGFAGMVFTAKTTSINDFNYWVSSVQNSPDSLSQTVYNNLALPSSNNAMTTYTAPDSQLYDNVMLKYMMPTTQVMNTMVSVQLTNKAVY